MNALLAGRRAVVTGAGRGIGRAVAGHLAAAGAAVVLAARTEREIEEAAKEIRSGGGRAEAVVCDITDHASVAALAEVSQQRLEGPVDTLVNNAGV